jgi:hypothetical protein
MKKEVVYDHGSQGKPQFSNGSNGSLGMAAKNLLWAGASSERV